MTLEQQLAAAQAEIARLTALLPPQPAPGQVWRAGTKNNKNLYAHSDDLAERGEAVGQMASAELAAHVVQAVNAWDWDAPVTEGRKVLDTPMDDRYPTIRDYLIALLATLWREQDGFSGKKPFGNSSWDWDLYAALGKAGLIRVTFDESGYVEDCDREAEAEGDRLIAAAISELGVAR